MGSPNCGSALWLLADPSEHHAPRTIRALSGTCIAEADSLRYLTSTALHLNTVRAWAGDQEVRKTRAYFWLQTGEERILTLRTRHHYLNASQTPTMLVPCIH